MTTPTPDPWQQQPDGYHSDAPLPYSAPQPHGYYPNGAPSYGPVMHQQPYAMPMYVTPPKDTTVAYLLAIFLGQFGAHNFYLGRTGCAVSQLVLWILGLATSWIGVGFILLFVVLIWWIVDLCSIPQYIREHTAMLARAWEQQQASHFGPY